MNLNHYTQKSLEAVQSARERAVQNGHQQLEQVPETSVCSYSNS